jgi:hypothetical protein
MVGVTFSRGQRLTIYKTYIYNIYCIYATYIYQSCLLLINMPTITVYLDAELYDYVKENPSAIIQRALKHLKEDKEVSRKE